MPLLAPLILVAAAAAQSAPQAVPAPTRHWGRLFISPMGEPFRARDRGDDPLADWFAQADRNHDGYLTLDEMVKDAERFFAVLDVNHDGEIDPDEITRYENVVAPEIQSGPHFSMMPPESGGPPEDSEGTRSGHRGRGGHHGKPSWSQGDDNESHQGAARFGLLDLPEPVVSADTDFNRGVSLDEFRQAAAQRFLALDVDHKGELSLSALENIRPAPSAQPHKPDGSENSGEPLPPGS